MPSRAWRARPLDLSDAALLAALPPEALQRSLPSPPPLTAALRRMVHTLQAGRPLVVTAIGQSNTAGSAGCFGWAHSGVGHWADPCAGNTGNASGNGFVDGFITTWMRWLNNTFPHRRHAFFNRAIGASSARHATACVTSHLAPGTHVLIVDFNLSPLGGFGSDDQERLARTLALLPRPPLVIYIGFPLWCTEDQLERAHNESFDAFSNRVRGQCHRDLRAGRIACCDPSGESHAPVARRYGQARARPLADAP